MTRSPVGRRVTVLAAVLSFFTMDAAAQTPPIVDLSPNAPGVIERGLCLTVAMSGSAAAECGDLRLAYAAATTQTMGRGRTPVLLYNSAHAHPQPVLRADVTLPDGTTGLERVEAEVRIDGRPRARSVYRGAEWPVSGAARVAVSYDALVDATSQYNATLIVTAHYSSGSSQDSARTRLVVVNRSRSAFGAGWWLAGLERLYWDEGRSSALWVGGDGSARRYTRVSGTTDRWVAPNPAWPDTLRLEGGVHVRRLPDNTRVEFDSTGTHVATVSREGFRTTFTWSGLALSTITLPVPAGSSAPVYNFNYDNSGRLYAVHGPPTEVGGVARTTWVDRFTDPEDDRVLAIQDALFQSTTFAYGGSANVITGQVDRRGAQTDYRYDGIHKLRASKLHMAAGDSIVVHLTAAESMGGAETTGAVPAISVRTLLDGARLDVADTTAFRLDRYGQPTRITDALGFFTEIVYNASYPALPVNVEDPAGRELLFAYDASGRLSQATDLSHSAGAATTT